jgi:hypothetical protein
MNETVSCRKWLAVEGFIACEPIIMDWRAKISAGWKATLDSL